MFQVHTNFATEETGERGALESTACDIYCKAVDSETYKDPSRFNYYSTSCAIRMKKCTEYDCPRNPKEKPEDVPKRVQIRTRVRNPSNRVKVNPIRECASCHKERKIEARGICKRCYQFHERNGSLEQFKTRNKKSGVGSCGRT